MTDPTAPNEPLLGIHHVTAIAGDPARNLDFYTRVLGQRLVKKTVNFDDPGTYHLYYADERGTPGTVMTFFPWPGARRGTPGAGQASVTQYAIPSGSAGWWRERLERLGVHASSRDMLGEAVVDLVDPDGLRLALVETAQAETEDISELPGWTGIQDEPVEAAHAIRGFRGVTIALRHGANTADFLREVMGMTEAELADSEASTGRLRRFEFPAAGPVGGRIDLLQGEGPGVGGAGTVHHVAFRIADDDAELRWQSFLARRGLNVSPVMDRQYFHSIYFREPGGVLFEIATDTPGFAVDEPIEALGEELRLPPGLETRREQIEAVLPSLGPAS